MSATDAAKERAAKLNAMLAAQGKLAKSNPPPVVVKHLFFFARSLYSIIVLMQGKIKNL